MEISQKKLEALNRQPIVETSIRRSEDGKWVIHKMTITEIRPDTFYQELISLPSLSNRKGRLKRRIDGG
jgi:hypothetical protein